ncbi:hypothetical protein OSB04_018547 [Centaurea solstitialis]|uniref:4-coumarate--CoA ligase n=1 Tax=Centaurea solstitialis TaxID=347529 RepID=A0AA38TN51_9ASTR|nr:hypothetical protein OSB04_018547 [Centaurea solstitialis]
MAVSDSPSSTINPDNGFCSKSHIYHSLRPPFPLPPQSSPFSVTDFIFSHLQTTAESTASFVDATAGRRVLYSDLPLIVRNVSASLRRPPLSLRRGDCAFVISPNSSDLPILYLSIFAIGAVVSPSNPVSSVQEIARQIRLSKPAVAFATEETARKLVEVGFSNPVVIIGSDEFESMMRGESNRSGGKIEAYQSHKSNGAGDGAKIRVYQSDESNGGGSADYESDKSKIEAYESDKSKTVVHESDKLKIELKIEAYQSDKSNGDGGKIEIYQSDKSKTEAYESDKSKIEDYESDKSKIAVYQSDKSNGSGGKIEVYQSDTAAILYSSGTTGNIKGVKLTHRNLISTIAGAINGRPARSSPAVYLCTVPLFHIYGFILCLRMVATGDSMVSMRRFELRLMLRSMEEFSVTHLAVAPPVVVALVDGNNDGLVNGTNWKSLEGVVCGGAPLTVPVIERFKKRFPNVSLSQAYGLTESTGGVSRVVGPYESTIAGTVGRLIAHCEAKIVDPNTGVGLGPMNPGELWVRGPFIMKGYVDDKDAGVESDGWLRTGDLCYFDNGGFLFVVDRLKELIKYKGYQVPPAELEHILHSHPDITEAAVIPYPDEEAGQVPMGFVVRRRGSTIDEAQVKDYVAKQVAPYKKLRRVRFVNTIPKNAPGKVLRKELVKLALSDLTSKL